MARKAAAAAGALSAEEFSKVMGGTIWRARHDVAVTGSRAPHLRPVDTSPSANGRPGRVVRPYALTPGRGILGTWSAFRRLGDVTWEVPREGGMLVPGLVFATDQLLKEAELANTLDQVRNVAHLPGIVRASMAMPDIHLGYGFPIGGVAATDVGVGGVVSPEGVGV